MTDQCRLVFLGAKQNNSTSLDQEESSWIGWNLAEFSEINLPKEGYAKSKKAKSDSLKCPKETEGL